jgi:hypothetical protein
MLPCSMGPFTVNSSSLVVEDFTLWFSWVDCSVSLLSSGTRYPVRVEHRHAKLIVRRLDDLNGHAALHQQEMIVATA